MLLFQKIVRTEYHLHKLLCWRELCQFRSAIQRNGARTLRPLIEIFPIMRDCCCTMRAQERNISVKRDNISLLEGCEWRESARKMLQVFADWKTIAWLTCKENEFLRSIGV